MDIDCVFNEVDESSEDNSDREDLSQSIYDEENKKINSEHSGYIFYQLSELLRLETTTDFKYNNKIQTIGRIKTEGCRFKLYPINQLVMSSENLPFISVHFENNDITLPKNNDCIRLYGFLFFVREEDGKTPVQPEENVKFILKLKVIIWKIGGTHYDGLELNKIINKISR